jgi:TP901 family phage tail tape measure protein
MDKSYRVVYKLEADDKAMRQSIKRLRADMATNAPKMNITVDPNTNRNVATINKGLAQVGNTAKKTEKHLISLGHATALAATRFGAFTLAATPMYYLVRAVSMASKEIVNFDKQMMRIGQTLGTSQKNLTGLSDQISNLAKNWGVSSSAMVDVARVLAQAGLSARETSVALETLAKSSLTPSFNDMTKTTEGAIAIMNQFGTSVYDLREQLSDINTVAKKFPVEAEDIITAVRKAGGVFSTTGGSLEQLIALFSAVRSTTRESAETIGTGFRTIFARLERTRTQNILANLGIDIRDAKDGYEAIGRIVQGIERLKKLGKAGEPGIAIIREELGGIRQIAKVIPLLTKYGEAQKIYASIQGINNDSINKDAIQAQESLAIQLDRTKEAWLSFTRAIANDTGIKTLVISMLQLAQTTLKVAETFKGIVPYLAMFAVMRGVKPALGFAGELKRGFSERFGRLPLAQGARVPTILTPGEAVFSPEQTKSIGVHRLEALNRGIVPGSGSRDSVPVDLKPGSFVLNKRDTNRIGLATGGRVGMWDGGKTGTFYRDKHFEQQKNQQMQQMFQERETELRLQKEQNDAINKAARSPESVLGKLRSGGVNLAREAGMSQMMMEGQASLSGPSRLAVKIKRDEGLARANAGLALAPYKTVFDPTVGAKRREEMDPYFARFPQSRKPLGINNERFLGGPSGKLPSTRVLDPKSAFRSDKHLFDPPKPGMQVFRATTIDSKEGFERDKMIDAKSEREALAKIKSMGLYTTALTNQTKILQEDTQKTSLLSRAKNRVVNLFSKVKPNMGDPFLGMGSGGGGPPVPPGGGGGGGGGGPVPPGKKPTFGERVGGVARNPMTWLAMGSLAPQAIEGMMSDKYKKTPTGQGILAGTGAGITMAATVAMINPVAGAIVGLGVGIKTFVDTVKAEEERLRKVDYSKSIDEVNSLLRNESKLRKVNNKKYESDLKKALGQREVQENIQYQDMFGARGQDLSRKVFEYREANLEFGARAQTKAYTGREMSDSEYRDLARSQMSPKQLENMWLAATQQAEGVGATRRYTHSSATAAQDTTIRNPEAERKSAIEYQRAMLTKFGKEKYAPEIRGAGARDRDMAATFENANIALNSFVNNINNTAQALQYARESTSKFDNQIAMVTGGKIQASTANLMALQNPTAVNSRQYMGAIRSTMGGNIGEGTVRAMDIARQIQTALPGVIERNIGTGGETDVDNIARELQKVFGNMGPDATNMISSIQNQLYSALSGGEGDEKAILDASDATRLSNEAMEKFTKASNEALQRVAEERIKIEQKYIDDLYALSQMRQKTTQMELGAGSLKYGIASGRQARIKEMGFGAEGKLSQNDAFVETMNQQKTILANTGYQGPVTDVRSIGNAISSLRSIQTNDPTQMVANQDKITRLEQALDNLRQSNVMLEQTQQELSDAMDRQNQARGVAEKYLTGSRSERRGIEKSMGYAEQLRQKVARGETVGTAEFDSIPRRYRSDVMGLMGSMSSLGGNSNDPSRITYGMAQNQMLDTTAQGLFGKNFRQDTAKADSNIREIENKQQEAANEQVRLQKEAEQKYQAVVIQSYKEMSIAFENASKNMLTASENMKNTTIKHEIAPVTVILQGDTAITSLEPTIKNFINQALKNNSGINDPTQNPAMNSARQGR